MNVLYKELLIIMWGWGNGWEECLVRSKRKFKEYSKVEVFIFIVEIEELRKGFLFLALR